jgi:hypothetical protein
MLTVPFMNPEGTERRYPRQPSREKTDLRRAGTVDERDSARRKEGNVDTSLKDKCSPPKFAPRCNTAADKNLNRGLKRQ